MDNTAVNLANSFWVIGIALASTAVAESINYYLIYRKPEYKELTKEIDATNKKIEQAKEKEDTIVDKKGAKKKKASALEQKLTVLQRDLTFMKFKSTILVTVLMIVTVSSMGNHFQGRPVARLPFEPFSLLTSISHRGLVGDDFTECSYIFIYVIVSYLIRGNIQKIFGFENNPKSGLFNPFGMQLPQQQ